MTNLPSGAPPETGDVVRPARVPVRLDHLGGGQVIVYTPVRKTLVKHNISPTIWVMRPTVGENAFPVRCQACGYTCRVTVSSRQSVVRFHLKAIGWGCAILGAGLCLGRIFDSAFFAVMMVAGAIVVVLALISMGNDSYASLEEPVEWKDHKPHRIIEKDNIDGMFPQDEIPPEYRNG